MPTARTPHLPESPSKRTRHFKLTEHTFFSRTRTTGPPTPTNSGKS
jgi:hypothetical protein